LLLEHAVAALMEDGDLQRHRWKMQKEYALRRDALAAALQKHLADPLRFSLPSGGTTLWVTTDPAISLETWSQRALQRGVSFLPGCRYAWQGQPVRGMRLGFAALTAEELQDAVKRMTQALPGAKKNEYLSLLLSF
jgi:GntR family transcriptional regulator / MocR family aminotransferase